MILRHTLTHTAAPAIRRSITTTPLTAASRHTRSRPPVRVPPRRHAPRSVEAEGVTGSASPTAAEEALATAEERRHPPKSAEAEGLTAADKPTAAEEAVTTTPEQDLPPVSRLEVQVPHDQAGTLDLAEYPSADKLRQLLSQPAIVVARQIEMMNLFLGYEQANKYQLLSPEGELLGYLMEEDSGIGSAVKRQLLRTHRPFKATVLSKEGEVLLIVRRPFAWINSRIYVCTPADTTSLTPSTSSASSTPAAFSEPLPPSQVPEDKIIGETQQIWHLYRRQYEHFISREGEMQQFASTDAGFLSWDFLARDEQGKAVGSINRNFAGFARELFTDTGQYVVRFEAVADEEQAALDAPNSEAQLSAPSSSSTSSTTDITPNSSSSTSSTPSPSTRESSSPSTALTVPVPSLGFDARAVLLASAITADIDYFSRHSGHGGMGGMGMMPVYIPGMGGSGAGAEGEAGAGAGVGGAEGAEGAEGGDVGRVQGEGDAPLVNDDGGWSRSGGVDGGGWGGWGSSSPSGGEAPATGGGGSGWGDEPMQDPWASNEGQAEDGGTWSWGDIFPSDD